jgi:hypothetical protein
VHHPPDALLPSCLLASSAPPRQAAPKCSKAKLTGIDRAIVDASEEATKGPAKIRLCLPGKIRHRQRPEERSHMQTKRRYSVCDMRSKGTDLPSEGPAAAWSVSPPPAPRNVPRHDLPCRRRPQLVPPALPPPGTLAPPPPTPFRRHQTFS